MDEYYWKKGDLEKLKRAETMPELLSIAYVILDRMPKPVTLVSGPISTGGKGSIPENLKAFKATIAKVRVSGETVFNQLPFEDKFIKLAEQSSLPYFTPILDEFFLPIFQSGRIQKIYFMPDWQSSTGAKWEYDMADKLGIEKIFIQ